MRWLSALAFISHLVPEPRSHQQHARHGTHAQTTDADGLRRSSTRLLESQLEQLRSLQESVVRMQGQLEAREDAEAEQRRLQAELQQLLALRQSNEELARRQQQPCAVAAAAQEAQQEARRSKRPEAAERKAQQLLDRARSAVLMGALSQPPSSCCSSSRCRSGSGAFPGRPQ